MTMQRPSPRFMSFAAAVLLCAAPALTFAQPASLVKVENAWLRPAVAGQSGTGGFARITSDKGATLVGLASPAAGLAEIHEMAMEGDVMKMRAVESLLLPAGKPVELKPGGHHLMLMQLKQPLTAGSTVPVTLKLKGADGKLIEQRVDFKVSATAPAGAPGAGSQGHDHQHKH
jgi:copper(I)-binding protein